MMRLRAQWTVSIEEDVLIREMLDTGEYGIGGYPISEESMVEFFRNRVFGVDPSTYQQNWASDSNCFYGLEITAVDLEEKQLWNKFFMDGEEK